MEIVVRQVSGLGNQLFQYAAGRYYARRHGAELRILVAGSKESTSHGAPRPFLLPEFCIDVPMEPPSLLDRLLLARRPVLQPVRHTLQRLLRAEFFTEPIEQRYRFLEHLPTDKQVRRLYLSGYWQAHQIVDSIGDELRPSLRFRHPPQGRNLEIAEQIQRSAHPVSLHIRRGDYTLAVEGAIALPIEYYRQAIKMIRERTGRPDFFVFSDDIAFARENLTDIGATFVDHNNDFSSHEDLRLMSLCHHHIIANSSFSWWGAWLNPRTDKTVVAPRFWHIHSESYFPDLLSPSWTLVAP